VLTSRAKVIPDGVQAGVPMLKKGALGMDLSPALFGVGYILGPRIATVMVSGGLLSSLIIIPTIAWWGTGRLEPLYPETIKTIAEMSAAEIWTRYVRYIGAGAVAAAGIITLARSIPVMIESFRIGAHELRQRVEHTGDEPRVLPRTARDLPLKAVGIGIVVIAAVLAFVPAPFGALESVVQRGSAAILVVIFAFFFVTVASRIVGMVGVTSNPTSGMTIASLPGTAWFAQLAGLAAFVLFTIWFVRRIRRGE